MKILERVTGDSEPIKAGIAQARINLEVAQMIYDARTQAGLSQSDLAALIGSKQSVIARLEDADYEGHSQTMLHHIAAALEQSDCMVVADLAPSVSVRSVKDRKAADERR